MALVILFIFFIDVCLFSCDENMVGSTLLQINTVAAFFFYPTVNDPTIQLLFDKNPITAIGIVRGSMLMCNLL